MKLEKNSRNVLKPFYDSTDKLKSKEHKNGRHYTLDGEYTKFPAINSTIDDERVKFLEDEGFISKEGE